jgi:hypothetical protein
LEKDLIWDGIVSSMERIFGKNKEGGKLNEKDLVEVKDELVYRKMEGAYEGPGELEKTPEDLRIIEEVNLLLNEELEALGIEVHKNIDPQTIHFLNRSDFLKVSNMAGPRAFGDPISGHIYVDNETKQGSIHPSDLNEFKLLLHESIHMLSHIKYYLDDQRKTLDTYRTGYFTNNVSNGEDVHDHFTGLNEAVTEAMALEVTEKNRATLDNTIHPTEEDWEYGLSGSYEAEREILEFIIKKIVEKNGEAEDEVWNRFKKGAFTGEMMHLRDIERVFGIGTLRVVAAIDSGTIMEKIEAAQGHVDIFKRNTVNKKILEYLQTGDENLRNAIASVILNDREYEGVIKRQIME